ncbi:substrate-binding domain-containing protein [Agromyces mangrovi Wang et al. 2018]|uniref:substrate-binding domain-containing protein n=1 Tax=Agromyces mangrovi TaxID=1858653 RepID=UPI002572633F|nr:substrate-binding domain-containing protein [Agromyces mangrovi]BDZ64756.1 sugar ABC transporter [Agromyces mangrovi]
MAHWNWKKTAAVTGVVSLAVGLSACGGSAGDGEAATTDDTVNVTLVLKDLVNPFFVALEEGAQEQAAIDNVSITVEAGSKDGDEQGQIQAIENAITRGDDGILILPSGPGVYDAIERARDAGLVVIGLDTPTDPADVVDLTFATDNFAAGEQIGEWAAAALDGEHAVIALLDQFNDRVIQTDLNRDQGFLTGMGIDIADPGVNGDEAQSGDYSGGTYEIACQEPTTGAEDGGRSAMENCLSGNSDINLVYTINEPAAAGAYAAIEAAGLQDQITIVSIDGACAGVDLVANGQLGATSMQFPVVMAQMGVEAVAAVVRGGELPGTSDGLEFFNTGTELVAADGFDLEFTTPDAAGSTCWG